VATAPIHISFQARDAVRLNSALLEPDKLLKLSHLVERKLGLFVLPSKLIAVILDLLGLCLTIFGLCFPFRRPILCLLAFRA
jgi:hypothetical protein